MILSLFSGISTKSKHHEKIIKFIRHGHAVFSGRFRQ